MEFGYRKSIISKNGYIALSAELKLQEGNYDEIKSLMDDLATRITKQPLNLLVKYI